MDATSTTVWQRRGSAVVFDKASLGGFISTGALVSLRQALTWSSELPATPPVPGRTILVSGLETVLETMAPTKAEAFLSSRVRPLLIRLQSQWTDCGVVFGFTSHANAFAETSLDEAVLFRRRDRREIRLSEALWDGTATLNMKRIIRSTGQGEEALVGYYVARIS